MIELFVFMSIISAIGSLIVARYVILGAAEIMEKKTKSRDPIIEFLHSMEGDLIIRKSSDSID